MDHPGIVEAVPYLLQTSRKERPLAQVHPGLQVVQPEHDPPLVVPAYQHPLRRHGDGVVLGTGQRRAASRQLVARPRDNTAGQSAPVVERIPAFDIHAHVHRSQEIILKIPHCILEHSTAAPVPQQFPALPGQRQLIGIRAGSGIAPRLVHRALRQPVVIGEPLFLRKHAGDFPRELVIGQKRLIVSWNG
jgi:hypothetical protein